MFNGFDPESQFSPEAFDFNKLSQTDLNIMGILGEYAEPYRILVQQGMRPQPYSRDQKIYIVVGDHEFEVTAFVSPQSLVQPGQVAPLSTPPASQLSSWEEFFRPKDKLTDAARQVKQEGWTNTSGASVEQIIHDYVGMWPDQYFGDEVPLVVLPEVSYEIPGAQQGEEQPGEERPQTEEECDRLPNLEERRRCKEWVRIMRDARLLEEGLCDQITDPELKRICKAEQLRKEQERANRRKDRLPWEECFDLPKELQADCLKKFQDIRFPDLPSLEDEPQTEEDCNKYTGTARDECLKRFAWQRQIKKAKELADRGILTSENPDKKENSDDQPKEPLIYEDFIPKQGTRDEVTLVINGIPYIWTRDIQTYADAGIQLYDPIYANTVGIPRNIYIGTSKLQVITDTEGENYVQLELLVRNRQTIGQVQRQLTDLHGYQIFDNVLAISKSIAEHDDLGPIKYIAGNWTEKFNEGDSTNYIQFTREYNRLMALSDEEKAALGLTSEKIEELAAQATFTYAQAWRWGYGELQDVEVSPEKTKVQALMGEPESDEISKVPEAWEVPELRELLEKGIPVYDPYRKKWVTRQDIPSG